MSQKLKTYVSIFLSVLLITACSKKLSEQELLSQAKQFEQQENHQEALAIYQKLIREYPKGDSTDQQLQKIAFIYYNNLNDFHKAIEYHDSLIKDFPESNFVPQARFMIGFIYANDLKDYDMARTRYNEFLEKHPGNELAESVKWELEHMGQDVNKQLMELFGGKNSNGTAK